MMATPGPWTVDADPPKYARIRAHGGYIVALVGNNENSEERTKHDAALIAAAPALADALAALIDGFDHIAHCRECGEMSVEHCAGLEGENSDAAKAITARDVAHAALRAAGRLP